VRAGGLLLLAAAVACVMALIIDVVFNETAGWVAAARRSCCSAWSGCCGRWPSAGHSTRTAGINVTV